MMRHAWAWFRGETYDTHKPDCIAGCDKHTGSHHLIAVAWHCFALVEFSEIYPEGDDRP
jgi:hypothetical protein